MLMPAFHATWFSLLAAPVAGVLLVLRWRGDEGPGLRRGVGWSMAYLGVVALCAATGLQWSSSILNFAFCLGCLYAYWMVAASAWAIPSRWIRLPLGILAFLPLIPSSFIGTIGLLGLLFILGDELEAPVESERLSTTQTCEITAWGSAVTDDGYTVRLYWSPAWFPLIRREMRAVSINETNPAPQRQSATCESVAAGL